MEYFQDFMPGNICFGCGKEHPEGLRIQSRWEGEESVATWHSRPEFRGWATLLNGGIIATLVDCHCMGTAMADAYRREHRSLDSAPYYRYATGTLTVKYLKPTHNDLPVHLRARVTEVKGRKTVLSCQVFSGEELTAEAEVVAIRVFDSSQDQEGSIFSESAAQ